ncbi:hypothetical protein PN36_20705 [Candidatus Thiomargarita nelsonii]|uniref:Uncharacterized protein n=1 Tax=Candidatus Thiomargarita nelsonii TaxID=1003181 RepID=A0A4E0R055_9GAMM|nr:hypothetical protein PN36_20705 [Candidatus Thiomargarita nelsonii]
MLKERFRNRQIENVPEHINKLRTARLVFDKSYDFKLGDLVVWKKGLKNKARPLFNEPAIVMQILDTPLRDQEKQDSGTPYFNEPLDLVLGLIDDDGDFVIFYYDKRRFEPYQE